MGQARERVVHVPLRPTVETHVLCLCPVVFRPNLERLVHNIMGKRAEMVWIGRGAWNVFMLLRIPPANRPVIPSCRAPAISTRVIEGMIHDLALLTRKPARCAQNRE